MLFNNVIFKFLTLAFSASIGAMEVQPIEKLPKEMLEHIAKYVISGGTIDQDQTNGAHLSLVSRPFQKIVTDIQSSEDTIATIEQKANRYGLDHFNAGLLLTKSHLLLEHTALHAMQMSPTPDYNFSQYVKRRALGIISENSIGFNDKITNAVLRRLARFYSYARLNDLFYNRNNQFDKSGQTAQEQSLDNFSWYSHSNTTEKLTELYNIDDATNMMNSLIKKQYVRTIETLLNAGFPSFDEFEDWDGLAIAEQELIKLEPTDANYSNVERIKKLFIQHDRGFIGGPHLGALVTRAVSQNKFKRWLKLIF